VQTNTVGAAVLTTNGAAGANTKAASGVHNSGTLDYSSNLPNAEVLVQYTVEPDADGDAYGDETQDRCVGTPGPCIPTLSTDAAPAPTGQRAAALKKCKKKKSQKARRKCKKKANLLPV
jgi:hypothetical protein